MLFYPRNRKITSILPYHKGKISEHMKKVNTSDSQKADIRIQLELTLKNRMSLIKTQ